MSPSGSEKASAANWKLLGPLPLQLWSGMGLATCGASLALAMAMLKSSLAVPPLPSSAVTVRATLARPTGGLPEKVQLAASKDSQDGSAPPPCSVAL